MKNNTYLKEDFSTSFRESFHREFINSFEKKVGRPPNEEEIQQGLDILQNFIKKAKLAGKVIGGTVLAAGIAYATYKVLKNRKKKVKTNEMKTLVEDICWGIEDEQLLNELSINPFQKTNDMIRSRGKNVPFQVCMAKSRSLPMGTARFKAQLACQKQFKQSGG